MDVERLNLIAALSRASFYSEADRAYVENALAKLQADNQALENSVEGLSFMLDVRETELREKRAALKPFDSAYLLAVKEQPDDVQSVQIMRSRVGFNHFRAASRALGGGE